MRNQIIGVFCSLALGLVPSVALANPPVRASAAMVGTAGMLAGEKAGTRSGEHEGIESGGAGGGGMSAAAIAGLALGLTGVALASYIALHKHHKHSPSPR